jgi:hypothetical protein
MSALAQDAFMQGLTWSIGFGLLAQFLVWGAVALYGLFVRGSQV